MINAQFQLAEAINKTSFKTEKWHPLILPVPSGAGTKKIKITIS